MVQCYFCHSTNSPTYIYAECSHFACTDCVSTKWDKKYSFKCCNQVTFLEEQTCNALQAINRKQQQTKRDQYKQNFTPDRTESNSIKIIKDEPPSKNREAQQSIYISTFEQTSPKKTNEKTEDAQLVEMESIMSDKIYKIKMAFEAQKQELERREQILLKQIYDTYSNHLGALQGTITDQDALTLKNKLDNINEQTFNCKGTQSKPDKILSKLEYNQAKMKEKLTRHYELLK